MRVVSDVKRGVEPNTTLRFITQFVMKATLRWSKLGPWLIELPHLGFHLERHVILPHYRDVNIFVDVTLGWLPLGASVTFLSLINNCVINYFHDHKSPFVLCLCVFSTRGTISGVCVFFTLCVFFECFFFSLHMFPLWAFLSLESILSLIWRFWSPHWAKVLNVPIDMSNWVLWLEPFLQVGHCL